MDMIFQKPGRPQRGQEEKMNLHHFRFDIFNTVIDLLINELDNRFSERSTELLLCVACLEPSDNFASFDKEKLIKLAQLYPSDFCSKEFDRLENQLDAYILDVCDNPKFANVKGIPGLAQKVMELKMDHVYFLI